MTRGSREGNSVVVPAVGSASSTACVRSLGRRDVHTIAVSERAIAPAFRSRYCEESIRVPSPTTDMPGYTNALLSLARRDEVRTIVPVREVDVYALAKHRSAFTEHLNAGTLWPSFGMLRYAHDRIALAEAARAAGVPEPNTRLLDAVDSWDRELIIKARYAMLAEEYVDSVSATESREVGKTKFPEVGVEPDREAIRAEMGHTPVVQDYVPGEEYSFRALYDHGEAVATTQKWAVRGFKYSRGPSVYHETARDPELEEAGRALLDHIEWHGLASVGFIRDASTGEFTLLEINPRFWASLPCDVHAGVDYPYYYWQLAGDGSTLRPTRGAIGAGSHLLRGEASHLYSILQDDYAYVERPSFRATTWDVLTSLYDQPHFDYLNLDDPGPFVHDLLNAVTGRA